MRCHTEVNIYSRKISTGLCPVSGAYPSAQLLIKTYARRLGLAILVTGCASIKSSGEPMMVDQSNYDRLNGSPATTIGTEYTPTESVKNTITDVLSTIGNEALRQPGRSQERRHHIEQVIRHRVNFGQMAQSSLGTPWTRLSDKERQEFVTLFVELIRDGLPTRSTNIMASRFSISMNNVRADLPRSEST